MHDALGRQGHQRGGALLRHRAQFERAAVRFGDSLGEQ
jgi:hypothetical protein